jgi:hypothetical protein
MSIIRAAALTSLSIAFAAGPALADENPFDRADPSVVEEELRRETQEASPDRPIRAGQRRDGSSLLATERKPIGDDAILAKPTFPITGLPLARLNADIDNLVIGDDRLSINGVITPLQTRALSDVPE